MMKVQQIIPIAELSEPVAIAVLKQFPDAKAVRSVKICRNGRREQQLYPLSANEYECTKRPGKQIT